MTPPQPIHPFLRRLQQLRRWLGRHHGWAFFSLLFLSVVSVLSWLSPLERSDRFIQDSPLVRLEDRPSPDIVLVTLDDAALEVLGHGPWDRTLHAEVIRQISAQEPRCIGFNMPLQESEGAALSDTQILAEAIKDSTCFVLPVSLQRYGVGGPYERTPSLMLAEAATGLGHVNFPLDRDGVVRGVFLQEGFEGRLWPHFSQVLFQAPQRHKATQTLSDQPSVPVPLGATRSGWVRKDKQVLVLTQPEPAFQQVSYFDVWRGNVPADLFKDRYVLVGVTAQGIAEAYATPGSSNWEPRPAALLLAHLLQSRVQGHVVRAALPWQNWLFNVLPLAIFLLALRRLRPLGMAVLLLTLLLVRIWVYRQGLWMGVQFAPAAGLLALLGVYPLWLGLRLVGALRFMRLATEGLSAGLEGFPASMRPVKAVSSQRHGSHDDFLDRQMNDLARASTRLRDVHRFARDGLGHLPDPTLLLDAKGRVLIANVAAKDYWEQQDLEGQDAHTLLRNLINKSNGRQTVPAGALTQTPTPHLGEAIDEQERSLLVRCVPFFDTQNALAGWMVALVDITPVRKTQAQRDEALRFISHDMREPMAAILTVLELHEQGQGSLSDAEAVARIRKHARTGLELSDGFVLLAQSEQQVFEAKLLNLVPMLQEAVDAAWLRGSKRRVDVRITACPEQAWVRGDRHLLSLALTHLVNHGLTYSPAGLQVQCSIEEADSLWVIRVHDEGPGVPAALQSQLFLPFHRMLRDTDSEVYGVGLGLLLVRTVALRHGGTVDLESDAGEGCTVTLLLPRPAEHELNSIYAELEKN